jgi:cell division transport system permease protein
VRSLSYSLNEALASLRRAGRSATMSIGTSAIAFLTLGGFLLASANLQTVVERWASAAEMSVYLHDEADEAARQSLQAELSAHGAVAVVEFVSREQALERFKSEFPELSDIAPGDASPFPASFEVRLRSDPGSAEAADGLAERLAARPAVADVRYDRRWLSRLLGIVTAIRLGGVAVAIVLVLGAAFTVAAVVRLSLEARRDEVEIMQLVGAPSAFVRGPFVIEGTIVGGAGAAVSLVVLWGLYVALRSELTALVGGLIGLVEIRFLGVDDVAVVLVGGVAVGALAGWVASRVAR